MILKNKQEKLRFGLAGVFNTVVDFGLLFTLRFLGVPPIVANIVSTSTAFALSFNLNKNIVFRAKGGSVRREVILFIITTLFGLWVLQTIVIAGVSAITPESTSYLLLGKILATAVTMCWNYFAYSRIVFKKN